MTDRPPSSLADRQLTVIRAFLRQHFPVSELIDRFDVEAAAHRFTLEPGRASRRTLLVPRGMLEDPALASLLSERLVEALRRAGARPVTQNIAVGAGAGAALLGGNKNIYLGHPGVSSESNTLRLGNTQKKTYIAGVATAAVTGSTVLIDATGRLGVPLSSARYKRDIETMGARSEGVLKLRPVTFAYIADGQGVRQYGLIAEEVATVYPELVTRTATGEVQAVRYQELIPMLVNELQRQQHVTEHLQRELAELRSLVGQMRGGVAQR